LRICRGSIDPGLLAISTACAAHSLLGVGLSNTGVGAGAGCGNFLMGCHACDFGAGPDFGAMQFPRNVGFRFDYEPKREYQI
jgi:hypothetical protein